MSESPKAPERALADLESRLRDAHAPVLRGLNKGMGEDSVRRALRGTGQSPDPALVALYTWHDGARGAGPEAELMDDARFMPLEEAIENRAFELRLAAENEDLPDNPAVAFFDPGWFPILRDSAGNLCVVERMGGGRVLAVDREDVDTREVLASSLIDFFDRIQHGRIDYEHPRLTKPADQLVRELASARSADRALATKELSRKRPAAAFEPLVSMLESDDREARRQAALVLGLLNDRRAVPILIRCLARWIGMDTNSAWGGLAAIGSEGAFGHLEEALKSGESELRVDAIKGLTISRDPRATGVISTAARDPDPAVREAAERALHQLGGI